MNDQQRTILRAAQLLYDRYVERQREVRTRSAVSIAGSAGPYLDQAFRFERLLTKGESIGLKRAPVRIRAQCLRALDNAINALSQIGRSLRESTPCIPALRDLFEELNAACDEFGSLEWDDADRRISVTTDPIVLDDVHLGSFRIDLFPDQIPHKEPANWFLVEALDPNPPFSNEEVTHPHVEHGRLCAGDAWHPINNALDDGRISEFFAVIRSVLETYNPNSPYVKLEDWYGTACSDCGCIVGEEDRFWCEGCDQEYCSECISYCRSCDTSLCFGCLSTCRFCDERVCQDCMSSCTECGETCCISCLDEGLCPECQQEKENTNDESEDDQATTSPIPESSGQRESQCLQVQGTEAA